MSRPDMIETSPFDDMIETSPFSTGVFDDTIETYIPNSTSDLREIFTYVCEKIHPYIHHISHFKLIYPQEVNRIEHSFKNCDQYIIDTVNYYKPILIRAYECYEIENMSEKKYIQHTKSWYYEVSSLVANIVKHHLAMILRVCFHYENGYVHDKYFTSELERAERIRKNYELEFEKFTIKYFKLTPQQCDAFNEQVITLYHTLQTNPIENR